MAFFTKCLDFSEYKLTTHLVMSVAKHLSKQRKKLSTSLQWELMFTGQNTQSKASMGGCINRYVITVVVLF